MRLIVVHDHPLMIFLNRPLKMPDMAYRLPGHPVPQLRPSKHGRQCVSCRQDWQRLDSGAPALPKGMVRSLQTTQATNQVHAMLMLRLQCPNRLIRISCHALKQIERHIVFAGYGRWLSKSDTATFWHARWQQPSTARTLRSDYFATDGHEWLSRPAADSTAVFHVSASSAVNPTSLTTPTSGTFCCALSFSNTPR